MKTTRRTIRRTRPNWENITIAIGILCLIIIGYFGGCEDPKEIAIKEGQVAGCHAKYGDDDQKCIDNLDQ